MLRSALSAKLHNLRLKGVTKHNVWDRLVFSKAKNAMGMKNVRLMISGGAPLPTQTMEVSTIFFLTNYILFYAGKKFESICLKLCINQQRSIVV